MFTKENELTKYKVLNSVEIENDNGRITQYHSYPYVKEDVVYANSIEEAEDKVRDMYDHNVIIRDTEEC